MPQYTDPGIPTLTQRAEPSLGTAYEAPVGPSDDDFPVLTDVAAHPDMPAEPSIADAAGPQHAVPASTGSADPTLTVLRAALQAELEQALNQAVEDAAADLRSRLEAELPALIDRAVRQVRPG
ncbi:hypothetical protein [Bordetella sp. 15P40C-2]|uniref:hypothetical protein n=1 Tax=Bordetella sp. 15P40C-2 TaxID=2572246 RepID=UPI0013278DCA|nr:hypothetical protein [Bordetella sp. 15P40C-2]MVW71890.1 hypothetical protein [Bordetella sp. 15P40C-2]